MSICKKCGGTGYYQYDDMHAKICDGCCKHDEGWWEVTEYYQGYEEGKDNRCCQRGCGTMYRDLKKDSNDGK